MHRYKFSNSLMIISILFVLAGWVNQNKEMGRENNENSRRELNLQLIGSAI